MQNEIFPQPIPETMNENVERNRLGKLLERNSNLFITDRLKRYAEVPDRVRFILHKESDDIQMLIIDGSARSLEEIKKKFTFIGKYISNFPEAKIVGDTLFSKQEEGKNSSFERNSFYRPLVYASMRGYVPHILFMKMIEAAPELRGNGIVPDFYKQLEDIARQTGYKFLAGSHIEQELASLYITRGRYLLEEIKPEFQKEFKYLRDHVQESFITIKFLNPLDAEIYINPDCVRETPKKRIEYKKSLET